MLCGRLHALTMQRCLLVHGVGLCISMRTGCLQHNVVVGLGVWARAAVCALGLTFHKVPVGSDLRQCVRLLVLGVGACSKMI